MNNVKIILFGENDESIKFLGLHLDEHLTWTKHIAAITSKISKSLFVINRVKYVLPHYALKTVYFSLVQSHLQYGIQAWGNATTISKLTVLQKRAIRIINQINYRGHTDPLFKSERIKKKCQTSISYMFPYLCLIYNLGHYQHRLSNSFPDMQIIIRVQSQDSMTTYSDKDKEQHSHLNCRNIILFRYGIASTNQQEIRKADIYLNVS